jgi:Na+-driven multidrug efflux pump
VVTGYFLMIATVGVGLWLTPFVLGYLGREEYAIFALSSDVLMWLGLIDIGMVAGLRAHAAQMTGRPNDGRLNEFASSAFFAQTGVVVVFAVIGGIVSYGFPTFFGVSPELQTDARNVMFLMVCGTALSIGTSTFSVLLVAHQQVHVDNLIGLLNLVIRTVLTVVLLSHGWGVVSLAVANIAARILTAMLAVWRIFAFLKALQIRVALISKTALAEMAGVGLWFSLGGMAGVVINSLSSIMTAKVVQLEMVTTLALTNRVYALSTGVIAQITDTARPMLGQLIGKGDRENAFGVYRHLARVSTGLAVVIACTAWSVNDAFVASWVGMIHYGGGLLDALLAVTIVAQAWILPCRAVMTAGLVVREQTLVRILEGALGAVLAYALGRGLGLSGVAAGPLIAAVTTSVWLLPLMVARTYGVSLRALVQPEGRRLGLFIAALFPVAMLTRSLVEVHMSLWAIGGAAAAVLGAGCILLWFVGFDAEMRKRAAMTVRLLPGVPWTRGTP